MEDHLVLEVMYYANPYYLGEASSSTKAWVAEVQKQANSSGLVLGAGKAIHVHGTPQSDRKYMPKPYNIQIVK